ncbi:MAG: peptidylprolyl isomerase [Spirochaetaceae bacterium]|nr:peptidylprolyl isomerase [Spirochaetaceae bacterium]
MKKTILFLTIILITGSLYSQSLLDKPAAIVKLTETEIISSKRVNQNISVLEANAKRSLTGDEKQSVLDSMIDSALVVQAARKENYGITAAQVKQYGIAQISQSVNRQLTEPEFNQLIEQQTKQPVSVYLAELEKQLLIQNYIQDKGRSDFQSIPKPSENEIQDVYKQEEMTFINPEMVRISHVYFSIVVNNGQNPRLMNETEKEPIRKKAESVLRDMKNGIITFEEGVRTYSEDQNTKVKAGDIGFLVRNDQNALQTFGPGFVEKVYAIPNGSFDLIESSVGYHIVKVTDQIEKKFLKLDDQINPMVPDTVREYISQRLYAYKQQELFQVVSERVVKELREDAEITMYLQNLGW